MPFDGGGEPGEPTEVAGPPEPPEPPGARGPAGCRARWADRVCAVVVIRWTRFAAQPPSKVRPPAVSSTRRETTARDRTRGSPCSFTLVTPGP